MTSSWRIWMFLFLMIAWNGVSAQSLRLACQFVPYANCTLRGTVLVLTEVLPEQLASVSIWLEHDSATLTPGLFEAWISLKQPTDQLDSKSIAINRAAEDDIRIYFRVRGDRASIDPRFSDLPAIAAKINSYRKQGRSLLNVVSQRIPIMLLDRDAVSARLKATLMYSKTQGPTSAIFMRPTNGCWYDEPSCVTGKPTSLPH